ncbi:Eukaryotic/viral aspartic protease [Phytophthora megakarya]|uniref:Eukaryotic/viral aspartic protease n=1 Tax=Phytophthora megakarya TaxID=4795 RepID=A0A225W8W2_9STRA|nr:Eukaryotic/viral aspartic protease [Phytophthora megakarya]
MEHSAGVDVVLGTDFMIPAGVRLDLFHGTARLPDEVTVPLVKSVLAYAEGRDDTLLRKEKELYECWLAEQPRVVERQEYTTPARILTRPTEDSVAPRTSALDHSGSDDRGDALDSNCSASTRNDGETSVTVGDDKEANKEPETQPTEFSDAGDEETDPAEDSVDMLELTYISVMHAGNQDTDEDWYEHIPNEMELADYQDEELRWANLKTVLRGDESVLTYQAARDAWKIADRFVLSKDDVLYHLGTRLLRSDHLQEEPTLRLVVATTMIQVVLQNCHDSLEGGHQGIARTFYRVKLDYYWVGLYADVARHVRSSPDCSSSKN